MNETIFSLNIVRVTFRKIQVVLWRWNDSEEKADVLAEYAASESVTAVTAIPKGGSDFYLVLALCDLFPVVCNFFGYLTLSSGCF